MVATALPDVLLIEPRVFEDARGFFYESYNRRAFADAGIDAEFLQDNHSRSRRRRAASSRSPTSTAAISSGASSPAR